jgi:AcrR family transcriptional regulator
MANAKRAARPYHHGNLREALVAASCAILDEEGAQALTLRSVARRVGVSHAAPKNHFGDLAGLLAAVAAEGFRRLGQAMRAAAASKKDPVRRLIEVGVAYACFAQASPGHFRAMFHPALGPRAPGSELEQASTAALGALISAVSAAQEAGQLRAGDPLELSLAAWSLVHGLAALVVDGQLANKGLPADPQMLARSFGEHLYQGLRAPPKKRARPKRR